MILGFEGLMGFKKPLSLTLTPSAILIIKSSFERSSPRDVAW
jgi:hypothetical protein